MKKGFHQASAKDGVTVGIAQLRTQAVKELSAARRKLGPNAAFNNAASQDNLIGSLIFGMLTGGVIMESLGAAFGGSEILNAANSPIVAVAADGLGVLLDDECNKNKARIVSAHYPKGRQAGEIAPVKQRFNLRAANQNAFAGNGAEADVMALAELIDMLDAMEKQGVSAIKIDPKASVYETIKKAQRRDAAAVRAFAAPVRKAA